MKCLVRLNACVLLLAVGCVPLLGETFPESDYTPFGYIDNPYHSSVQNRSGLVRAVPPIGFGFWARRMPFPYGDLVTRPVNYLSVLQLSLNIDGVTLDTSEDFTRNGINLVSKYHTKTMLSYDWDYSGLTFRARYFLANENSLMCLFDVRNSGPRERTLRLHATNTYGFPSERWWGSDGVAALYNNDIDAGISKIWAYGDVFVADHRSAAHKATSDDAQRDKWVRAGDVSSVRGATVQFPGHMNTVLTYRLVVPAGGSQAITIALTRDVNEANAVRKHRAALRSAEATLREQLVADDVFYAQAPVLTGDWPPAWKHGWIYDLETLRMNIRRPAGIYKHPWDGMQVFSPRQVLGESMLDSMALSYADVDLAKAIIYGTFADSPAPQIPCTREDASVNMICADGSETGTAPIWGFPFHMIRSIYERDQDAYWIKSLYPRLKSFLDWWLKNRTDKDGWFHSKCSWESGQDGSKRFLVAAEDPGAVADFVRTVDIEAAMAEAFQDMERFADIAGESQDVARWKSLADRRIDTTRSMFVDGWFRDFDARTNQPILLKDYWDVMMLTPVTLGIASPQQSAAVKNRIEYLHQHPNEWLVWPPVVFTYVEAAWNAGMRPLAARTVAEIGDRIYTRLDGRTVRGIGKAKTDLPSRFAYRIPGVAGEYWPPEDEAVYLGAENYGWGATLPTLVIRNILGFREVKGSRNDEFLLAPQLPASLLDAGKTFGITNLKFRGLRTGLTYESLGSSRLAITLLPAEPMAKRMTVRDQAGRVLASTNIATSASLRFDGTNGNVYTVTLE